MPWGHIYDQSLEAPVRDTIKRIGHDLMMGTLNKGRPDFLHKCKKVHLGRTSGFGIVQLVQKYEDFLLFVFWKRIQLLRYCGNIHL